jgi:hypothetical protein
VLRHGRDVYPYVNDHPSARLPLRTKSAELALDAMTAREGRIQARHRIRPVEGWWRRIGNGQSGVNIVRATAGGKRDSLTIPPPPTATGLASGGAPTSVTLPDSLEGNTEHRWPVALPDGETVLFVSFRGNVNGL